MTTNIDRRIHTCGAEQDDVLNTKRRCRSDTLATCTYNNQGFCTAECLFKSCSGRHVALDWSDIRPEFLLRSNSISHEHPYV
jgi:hypothetical protein